MIALSMHQITIQLTIVQRNINLPNHELVSLIQLKQQYIYCKLLNNFSISIRTACKSFHNISAHNWLSINQHTVQLTIVQSTISYQTMNLQVSYNSSRIMSNANTQLVQHFHSNSVLILSQYICA